MVSDLWSACLRARAPCAASLVLLGGCAFPVEPRDPPPDGETKSVVEPNQTLACGPETRDLGPQAWLHVPWDTPVEYESNPPAGGPHYAVWAAYASYKQPLDRRLYVHNLEHGAVALVYRCVSRAACPELASELEQFAESLPIDATCTSESNVARRIVITADPLLDVPIAAASWGATYRAGCFDDPSLRRFVTEHYGHGREDICTDGLRVEP